MTKRQKWWAKWYQEQDKMVIDYMNAHAVRYMDRAGTIKVFPGDARYETAPYEERMWRVRRRSQTLWPARRSGRFRRGCCNVSIHMLWNGMTRAYRQPKVSLVCNHCGSAFLVEPYKAKLVRTKFCSRRCRTDFAAGRRLSTEAEDRALFSLSFVKRETGCWEWTECRDSNGYGLFFRGAGKSRLAHRASWEFKNGPIESGWFVLHRCDNPCCVNPDHLFLGSQQDNIMDMVRKQRNQRGSRRPAAKLTEDVVRSIRSTTDKSHTQIAREFGVARSVITNVINRKAWRHVA